MSNTDELKSFRVIWQIDTEASNAVQAAMQVAKDSFLPYIARGSVGSACVFEVQEQQFQVATGKIPAGELTLIDLSTVADQLDPEGLRELYGVDGHPIWQWADWRDDVANEDTELGYWAWLQHKIEANKK